MFVRVAIVTRFPPRQPAKRLSVTFWASSRIRMPLPCANADMAAHASVSILLHPGGRRIQGKADGIRNLNIREKQLPSAAQAIF